MHSITNLGEWVAQIFAEIPGGGEAGGQFVGTKLPGGLPILGLCNCIFINKFSENLPRGILC